jgi:hypothetical protein
MSNEYDYKHNKDAKRVEVRSEHQSSENLKRELKDPILLDNRVLTFSPFRERLEDGTPIGQRIEQGGLFSIDNLHPTVVGYALLAKRLLDEIVRAEPTLKGWQDISPAMAYAREFKTIENGKEVNRDGNVLRRLDRHLAARELWLQSAFDLGAGGQRLDCWRTPGDEEW